MQDLGDTERGCTALVDLGFPEFTRYVRALDSELATAILKDYPTAEAFRGSAARLVASSSTTVGTSSASSLRTSSSRPLKLSVGRHHGYAYRVQVQYFCEDIDLFAALRELDQDIESQLDAPEVGKLLTTIDGIGPARPPGSSPSSATPPTSGRGSRSPPTSVSCPAASVRQALAPRAGITP